VPDCKRLPIRSALPQSPDLGGAHRHFAFVPILLQKSFCTHTLTRKSRLRPRRIFDHLGTSSPDEKLTRDLARVIEAISIPSRDGITPDQAYFTPLPLRSAA
jgi:hypothetical protein